MNIDAGVILPFDAEVLWAVRVWLITVFIGVGFVLGVISIIFSIINSEDEPNQDDFNKDFLDDLKGKFD